MVSKKNLNGFSSSQGLTKYITSGLRRGVWHFGAARSTVKAGCRQAPRHLGRWAKPTQTIKQEERFCCRSENTVPSYLSNFLNQILNISYWGGGEYADTGNFELVWQLQKLSARFNQRGKLPPILHENIFPSCHCYVSRICIFEKVLALKNVFSILLN